MSQVNLRNWSNQTVHLIASGSCLKCNLGSEDLGVGGCFYLDMAIDLKEMRLLGGGNRSSVVEEELGAMTQGDVKKGVKTDVLTFLALVLWLGGIHLNLLVVGLCFWNLHSPWAITLLAFWVTLMFIPVRYDGALGRAVARFICKYAVAYFPIKVVLEDENAFDFKKSYVFAAEPHSLLPIAIVVFTPQSGVLPVTNIRGLATSAIFWTPVLRHVWSWMGGLPVTRKRFTEFLQGGTSVLIVPGGVQECLYMERGREVVYLKRRFGFVKVAIEAGSPIVPMFCFGQTNSYSWWKPTGQWYSQLSRAIGFTPLVFWGRYGLPIPFRTPMTYVIGRPIEVTKNAKATHEEVAAVLNQYIEAVRALYENHKTAAGFNDIPLHIY